MSQIEKLLKDTTEIGKEIKLLLRTSTYDLASDLSAMEYDKTSPEECLIKDELRDIFDKFSEAYRSIEYLNKEVYYTGLLEKNKNGRYETDREEYRSGSLIEALVYDDFYERYKWIISRVEYDGSDYYIDNYKDVKMDGLKVRMRQ